MASNKGTRREILEIDAALKELERARPFLQREFYDDRTQVLCEKKDELNKKLEDGRLAPDIQYIITEVEG